MKFLSFHDLQNVVEIHDLVSNLKLTTKRVADGSVRAV
jgi:hypothetical protein